MVIQIIINDYIIDYLYLMEYKDFNILPLIIFNLYNLVNDMEHFIHQIIRVFSYNPTVLNF